MTAPVGQGALPGVHDEPAGKHGQLTTLEAAITYVYAGHATFTLVSRKTGHRHTLRVRQAPRRLGDPGQSPTYFVDALVGPDNTRDFRYLGFVCQVANAFDIRFKVNKDSWRVEVWHIVMWFLLVLARRDEEMFQLVEVWHTGRCGRCGRTLTVPESITTGLGPVCAEK